MIINKIKQVFAGEKADLERISEANGISLDFSLNRKEIGILKGIFEEREYADYFPFYQKVNIIDIGAHCGYFSLFAHKNTNKDSRIISVEPDNGNFEILNKNLRQNITQNVKTLNCAVGEKEGTTKLYTGRSSNNSLLVDYSMVGGVDFVEVPVRTLKEIIEENNFQKVDFLKMDCEGSEYAILETLPSEVFEKIETISMEFHDLKSQKYTGDFLMEILLTNGFEIVKYNYEKTRMGLNYGKMIGTKKKHPKIKL